MLCLGLVLGLVTPVAMALPFASFDARSTAMGGVGVATGARYAAFNNPALLTAAEEIHEWFLLAPALSQRTDDPDKVDDALKAFQQSANVLDGSPTATNRDAVQAQLSVLTDTLYTAQRTSALMVSIPSRILSGAAFFNVYQASTAQPQIGGDDLLVPSYTSTLAHRGLRIAENGVAVAKILEVDRGWMRNLAIGFSVKFLLVEGYGYSAPLRSTEVDVDRAGRKIGSQFAFDLGLLKELGVWKLGLVAKNIVPGNYEYGDSGDTFKIEPQLRAGFAYQGRYSVLEMNIDLLENAALGFAGPTQTAALGWEWQTWRWLALRAGYNQNLTGDEAAYASLGVGVIISEIVHLDVAGFSGDQSSGLSAQLGVQF